jgi:hypothetical protein
MRSFEQAASLVEPLRLERGEGAFNDCVVFNLRVRRRFGMRDRRSRPCTRER